MLKYIPEISDQTGANYAEIIEEVIICEEEGAL
jgi:hypothetical protein